MSQEKEKEKYPILEEIGYSWSGLGNFIENEKGNLKELLQEIVARKLENERIMQEAEERIRKAKENNSLLFSTLEHLEVKTGQAVITYLDNAENKIVSISKLGSDVRITETKINIL